MKTHRDLKRVASESDFEDIVVFHENPQGFETLLCKMDKYMYYISWKPTGIWNNFGSRTESS